MVAAGFVPFACTSDSDNGNVAAGAGQAGEGAGGGSAGAGGSSAGAGSAGEVDEWKVPCTAPELDALSGLVACREGYSHRPSAVVCWGETGAALEALRESEQAADPAIATTFRRIAEDEHRHAELAFRFLRWAFDRAPAAVAERLHASQRSPEWRDHPARSVVTPCFDALLATARLAA